MEFALKSEIYCFIHLHSLLRIVFVHNIYYIFAKLSLANIRSRFSNKPIVHSRHRGRYTQKFKNNHFTFLKTSNCVYLIEKNPSPIVQSNCPVQLSSPTVQSSPCFVLCHLISARQSFLPILWLVYLALSLFYAPSGECIFHFCTKRL